jgi:hypothetical protein
VPTQTWRVVVTKLGGSDIVGEVEVDASNWMGALRVGRERLGEAPAMPAGASCSVDGAGIATVLDPAGRRKLVLTPLGPAFPSNAPPPEASSQPVASARAPVAPAPSSSAFQAPLPAVASAPAPAVAEPGAEPVPGKKRKRFETVAFVPGHLSAMNAPAPVAVVRDPAPQEPAPSAAPPAARQPSASVERASNAPASADRVSRTSSASPGPRTAQLALELLQQRSEDPSPNNPICYRERAYFLPRGVTVQEAEASLRFELVAMQDELKAMKRGKLINLAAFDHRWTDAPERSPVVTLQWRDWKGEVLVDFPAARIESPRPRVPSGAIAPLRAPASEAPAPHDDRLDEVFQGLAELSRLATPVDGLDLAVRLLEHYVPSEALSACLYDINTDELRFVSVLGSAAAEMQGRAVPLNAGLLGLAFRKEHRASIFGDVLMEPAFSPETDTRPGLDARSMLLCPVISEGHLLGGLQLINRLHTHRYSQADANLASYIAERLGEFLHELRKRAAAPQGGRR